MWQDAKSIRTFIGARNFEISRQFYRDLGFIEYEVSADMSFFSTGAMGFYLQDYYVRDWVNNSMIFLEVEDVSKCWSKIESLGLHLKYKKVKLTPIKKFDWGSECFLHDPSGVLWHFGEFKISN